MDATAYNPTLEDVERIARLSGIDLTIREVDEPLDDAEGPMADLVGPADVQSPLEEMGKAAFSGDGNEFAWFAHENRSRIHEAAHEDERVTEVLVLAYKMGIAAGSAACMNDLGTLYYRGDLVEQNYARAAELYEMAAAHGCLQSVINLGYIHEYGRTGERDYAKAYRCYALASALEPSCEALYKLGDMYSRGATGTRDMATAKVLWERSLELAQGAAEAAQPAIRIATLLVDPGCDEWGIEPNPLRALSLYQQAEVGLRIDITQNGLTYYQRRLEEAIEGQARARKLVEEQADFF